jgi:hypothetical protein
MTVQWGAQQCGNAATRPVTAAHSLASLSEARSPHPLRRQFHQLSDRGVMNQVRQQPGLAPLPGRRILSHRLMRGGVGE